METVIFKTNMKCSGCIEKVTPGLNELLGKDNWKVDLQNPGKTLMVTGEDMITRDVQSVIERAGFKVERA